MTSIDEAQWVEQLNDFLDRRATAQAEGGEAMRTNLAASAVLANRPIDSSITTSLKATKYAQIDKAVLLTRPQWSLVALPYITLEPTLTLGNPVRAGNFLLWPDPQEAQTETESSRIAAPQARLSVDSDVVLRPRPAPIPIVVRPIPILPQQRAFFALATPNLLDLSLTVQATVQPDRSIRITGGTAILTVGVYVQEQMATIERYQTEWAAALTQAGYGRAIWKFLPVNLRNVQVSLELPTGHAVSPPQTSTNPGAGTATCIIELSEVGVMAWKTALEQRNGGAIPGICHLTVSYYGQPMHKLGIREERLSAPLGSLLVQRGPDDIHVINPQQTVEAKLLAIGHDLVQSVALTLRPNVGQAPEAQVFDQNGGQVNLAITTQQVAQVEVDWNAQVTFKSTGWPVIPASGKLTSTNGWVEVIKPDSWIASYTFMAVLVDAQGNPVPLSTAGSNYHVNGVLTFTAPYIPVTNILVAPFDLSNQMPVSVALPRFPGQPFGELVLNMFATRDGQASTQTRKLTPTELSVVMIIRPNAQIEIRTANDALPELSFESEALGMIELLRI